jgi:hypothetical protein
MRSAGAYNTHPGACYLANHEHSEDRQCHHGLAPSAQKYSYNNIEQGIHKKLQK